MHLPIALLHRFLRLNNIRHALDLLKLVQLRLCQSLAAQNVRFDPPRQVGPSLVLHVFASRNAENVVELFKRTLLGFRKPEETADFMSANLT